jgi:hypothetical protein
MGLDLPDDVELPSCRSAVQLMASLTVAIGLFVVAMILIFARESMSEPVRVIPCPTPFPTQESSQGSGNGNGLRLSGNVRDCNLHTARI